MWVWKLIVAGTALGGAMVLWHTISRSKHASQEMLRRYSEMLSAARAEKARQLASAAEEGTGGREEVR